MDPIRLAFDASVAQTLESQEDWLRRTEILAGEEGLLAFLRHVRRWVPYFQQVGKDGADGDLSLDSFPITSRDLVSSQRFAFMSSKAGPHNSPLFARTSGSSGHPLTVRFGPSEWYELNQASYRRIAEYFPQLKALAQPGRLSVAMIHDGANRQTTSSLLFELNYSVFSRFVLRDDPAGDAELVGNLRNTPIHILNGKPAYLLKLAHLDEKYGPDSERIRPSFLFTSGENLYRDQRRELETHYGCGVINAYTSVEGGLLALQCPNGESLHVDSSRTLLEVVTSGGEIRTEGEGEFLLTNLWNWTMPFIRYRTGDYGIIRNQTCSCGHSGQTIVRLDGRELGSFQVAGDNLASQELDDIFKGLGIRHFQLEQRTESNFELSWVADEAVAEELLIRALRQRLGDVHIHTQRVIAISKRGFKTRRYSSLLLNPAPLHRTMTNPCELHAPVPKPCLATLDSSGRYLAVVKDDFVDIIDFQKRDTRPISLDLGGHGTTCLQFSPTDHIVAVGTSDRRLHVWDFAGSARLLPELRTTDKLTCLTFSYDGTILATGGAQGSMQAWQLDENEDAIATSVPGGDGITHMAASMVSRFVAISRRNHLGIEIRTLPDLDLLSEISATGIVESMAFMIDENILAVGYNDGCVELWNVDTQERVAAFRISGGVSAIAFCQSTQTLVTGSELGDVTLWDVWRGRQKTGFQAHSAAVIDIAILREGSGFVTLAKNASVKQWPW